MLRLLPVLSPDWADDIVGEVPDATLTRQENGRSGPGLRATTPAAVATVSGVS